MGTYKGKMECPLCHHTSMIVYLNEDDVTRAECHRPDCQIAIVEFPDGKQILYDNNKDTQMNLTTPYSLKEMVEESKGSSIELIDPKVIKQVDRTYRCISPSTFSKFRYGGYHKNGTDYEVASIINDSGVVQSQNVRFQVDGKKSFFRCNSPDKDEANYLFGQYSDQTLTHKKMLVITEGELDCMSVYQAYAAKGDWIPFCVSLPGGSGSVSVLADQRHWLNKFEEIYLCFDADEAGQAAVKKAIKILGTDKVREVKLKAEYKDANGYITAGAWDDLRYAINNATSPAIPCITRKHGILNMLNSAAPPVLPTGVQVLDKILSGGLAYGGLNVIVGGTGLGKCLGFGTKVMMSNGVKKEVQDIQVGDYVMAPTGDASLVVSLAQGTAPMYRLTTIKGESHVVNENHVLSLVVSNGKRPVYDNKGIRHNAGSVLNIEMKDYLMCSNKFKHTTKLWKPDAPIVFEQETTVDWVDPYYLGVWLGDGTSSSCQITNQDTEVVGYLQEFCQQHQLTLKTRDELHWDITTKRGQDNPLLIFLQDNDLIMNKHIPHNYLMSSVENRYKLLAGLLDTDGHLSTDGVCFDYVCKQKALAEDIQQLALSLGLQVKLIESWKSCQTFEAPRLYYRLTISGDTYKIPTKIERKVARKRLQKKTVNRFGFTVEALGVDNYYGFNLNTEDKLFLLADFIVSHNSTIAYNAAANILRADKKVLVLNTEMKSIEPLLHFMSAYYNTPFYDLYSSCGSTKEEVQQWVDVVIKPKAEAMLKEDNLTFFDGIETTPWTDAFNSIKAHVEADGVSLIVLDNLTGLSESTSSKKQLLDTVLKDLNSLCRQYEVTGLILSHLTKNGGGVTGKDGSKGITFETGAEVGLDNIADSSHTAKYGSNILSYERDINDDSGSFKIRLLKSRYKGTGKVEKGVYNSKTCTFTDVMFSLTDIPIDDDKDNLFDTF